MISFQDFDVENLLFQLDLWLELNLLYIHWCWD